MANKKKLPLAMDGESRAQWKRPSMGIPKENDDCYPEGRRRAAGIAAKAAKAGEKSPTKSKSGY